MEAVEEVLTSRCRQQRLPPHNGASRTSTGGSQGSSHGLLHGETVSDLSLTCCCTEGILSPSGHLQEMLKVDELRCNPFAARIVELFSEDGSGEIDFQKFINIFSVFSSRATVDTKMVWAFAIWDFDGELQSNAE